MRKVSMLDRWRMQACFLVPIIAVVSVAAVAQVRPFQTSSAASGGLITVFGADQSPQTAADAVQLQRLDGSLRGIARAAAGQALTVAALRNLNPAIHVRLAAPSITPEVLVDVVAGADPASTQQALESLGMREVARAKTLIGGWLPATALAQAAQLPGLNQVRA